MFFFFFSLHNASCRPSWSLAGVVGIISCGLLLLVYGESNFNPLGFAVVMTASMLSGLRWTITQVLLQGTPGSTGHGASGGPVEVLLQLTPGHSHPYYKYTGLFHLCLLQPHWLSAVPLATAKPAGYSHIADYTCTRLLQSLGTNHGHWGHTTGAYCNNVYLEPLSLLLALPASTDTACHLSLIQCNVEDESAVAQ